MCCLFPKILLRLNCYRGVSIMFAKKYEESILLQKLYKMYEIKNISILYQFICTLLYICLHKEKIYKGNALYVSVGITHTHTRTHTQETYSCLCNRCFNFSLFKDLVNSNNQLFFNIN